MKEEFMILKKYKYMLSKQQYKTFKGQILAGNIDGFRKGLFSLIMRKKGYSNERIHNRETNRVINKNINGR